MKKILLASTILAGTAGFAAADYANNGNFTFAGEAYVGVGIAIGIDETVAGADFNDDGDSTDTDANTFRPEISASFTAKMVTMTDHGLEAGASITIDADGATFESDHTEDAFGIFSEDGEGISNANMYLSGDWGKVKVDYDNDGRDIGATSTDWDVKFTYSHTFGDFAVEAYYTIAIPFEVLGVNDDAGTNGDLGAKATYTFGDYSVYASFDYDASDTRATPEIDSPLTFDVGGSATVGDFSMTANLEYNVDNDGLPGEDSNIDWKVTADYGMDAWSVGVFAEDDGRDDDVDLGLHAHYDLGGGVMVKGSWTYDQDGVDLGGQDVSLFRLGVAASF